MARVFYVWFDLHKDAATPFDDQWARVKQVAAGIAALTPVLLSVEEVPAIRTATSPAQLDRQKHEGTVYLIAVNNAPEKHVAAFSLPKRPGKRSTGYRGGMAPPDRRNLELQFDPLEVHVVALHGMERAWGVGFTSTSTWTSKRGRRGFRR